MLHLSFTWPWEIWVRGRSFAVVPRNEVSAFHNTRHKCTKLLRLYKMSSCKVIANKLDITCGIFSYPDGTKLLAKIQSADSSSLRGNVRSTIVPLLRVSSVHAERAHMLFYRMLQRSGLKVCVWKIRSDVKVHSFIKYRRHASFIFYLRWRRL